MWNKISSYDALARVCPSIEIVSSQGRIFLSIQVNRTRNVSSEPTGANSTFGSLGSGNCKSSVMLLKAALFTSLKIRVWLAIVNSKLLKKC